MKEAAERDFWRFERQAAAGGYQSVCGADEAGAGPLAGRVYAAAVILPEAHHLNGLDDSKKVPPKRRERLFDEICACAVAWAVSWAEAEEVDSLNILRARLLAMERAIQALPVPADFALLDGNRNMGITLPNEMVVKGDSFSASIAAASILAKVSRDRYMEEMALLYPQYEFAKHKGYPTKRHYELLRAFGPCPIHRQTFLRNV